MRKRKTKSTAVSLIWQTIGQKKRLLSLVILLSLLLVGLTSVQPMVCQGLIDDGISSGSVSLLLLYAGLLIGLPLLATSVSYGKDRAVYLFSNAISEELRRKGYAACLYMEYPAFQKIGYQKAMKAITRQVGQICDVFICGEVITVINSLLQFVVACVLLASISWILALACLVAIPILFFIVRKHKDSVGNLEKKLFALLSKCDNYLTHTLTGLKTVKALNAQDYEIEEFDQWLEKNQQVNWGIKSAHSLSRKILPGIAQQLSFGLLLFLCALSVRKGQMSMGALFAGISYIPILFASFNNLLGIQVGYAALQGAIDSLDELLDAPRESGSITQPDPAALPVMVRDLDFSYGREGFRLTIGELAVHPGEMVAIVGESGSGKSALFDVLCRFYPAKEGQVEVFGQEISRIDPIALRQIVGFSTQESTLWNKSIEENILYPRHLAEKDNARYLNAVERSGLRPFLDSLPEGDQTLLGDFGSQVSGGERQRIALARALYAEYPILLLDEPTAALDSFCAHRVFDTLLEERKKGKTVIVITHDLVKAMTADRILAIRYGEAVEYGTPEELLARNGYVKRLCTTFTEQ